MRVLHVITRMVLGGAQENTLLTCEGLHARGYQVCLATGPALGPEGDLLTRAARGGYSVELLPSLRRDIHPLLDPRALLELDTVVRRFRPDIVHTHSSKAGILGRLVGWIRRRWNRRARAPRPLVVHTLHGLAYGPTASQIENAVYIPLERWAAGVSDALISVADALTAQSLAAGVGRAEQYRTIRSGLELAPFLSAPALRDSVRAGLGVRPNELLVGTVARLAPRKGLEDVLTAAETLCPRRPELKFALVGDGELRPRLEARVRRAGLTERVILTGLVATDRIPGLMASFDVLLHASRREGLPRVVPQALLAGTPVVVCNVDGAPEVVWPDRTGFLFEPGDTTAMLTGLDRLLTDATMRHRLASTGRDWCRQHFSADGMVHQIEALYRELLVQNEKF